MQTRGQQWLAVSNRLLTAALTLGLAAVCGHARAQASDAALPGGPVRIVVGFPPGGGIDSVARVLIPRLTAALKQPVIVENRPGANGMIAMQQVASAPPNGQSIFFGTTGNLSVNPVFLKSPSLDIEKAFVPVTQLATVNFVLLGAPTAPYKDLPGLIRYAKANPGKIAFASSGNGGLPHLAAQLLSNEAGLNGTHVAYKGSAPALSDVMAGHVNFVIDAAGLVAPQVHAGKVRAIATTSSERLAALPDVATVAETIPGFEVSNYYGAVVRAGTPVQTVQALRTAIVNAMADPEVRQKMITLGATPVTSTSEAFGDKMRAESKRWARVIREANIKPD